MFILPQNSLVGKQNLCHLQTTSDISERLLIPND